MDNSSYSSELDILKSEHNYRALRYDIHNFDVNLSSNDYLYLQNDESLYQAFLQSLKYKKHRFSAASSRLLTGNSEEYLNLENWLKLAFNREAAMIYNSGYHANCGILPALTTKKDLIVADKLVHASIIDGIKLSDAKLERYKHLNYNHLKTILEKYTNDYNRIFIVTESVFSMDGDVADLQQLVSIKQKYNAYLYVDEAHAFGVRGKNGLGCVEEQNCVHQVDFIVGTFGKAIASVGAYVICDEVFKDYLINRSRTAIFTTALPPINLAWTLFVCEKLNVLAYKRNHLHAIGKVFSEMLGVKSDSNIIPYIIGKNAEAIAVSEKLQNKGILVLPVRYPTVAKGTARLRFSLHAGLEIKDLENVSQILLA